MTIDVESKSEDMGHQHEGRAFRWTIGLLVMLTAILGFGALFYLRVPDENKDAMMFALGSIFGWAAAVVGSEYGSTTTGRKVAESAIRKIERDDIAAPSPGDVQDVKVVNPINDPVPTTTEGANGATPAKSEDLPDYAR